MSDSALIPTTGHALGAEEPRSRGWELALRWGLLLVLALAPMPLASDRPLAWSILALASGALLVVALACELSEPTSSSALKPLRIPILLATLVALWAAAQALPVGLAALHPPLWDMAAKALEGPVRPSISIDREASLARLLRLLSYAAIFLAAWRIARRSDGAGALARGVAAIGAAYALYGLIVYLTGSRTILWLTKWAYSEDLTSTFVNRNSFATYLGLGLMAGLGLLVQVFARHVDSRSRRTLLRSTVECLLWHGRWPVICLLLAATALLFTHSRGGTLSSLLGAAALLAAAMSAPSLRGDWRLPMAAFAVAGVLALLALHGSGLMERIAAGSIGTELRVDINSGTLRAIADHPLLGTGLGTFQWVYAPYQSPSTGVFVDLAHDDYLENVLELGLPAAAALYAALLLLALHCALGVFRRRRNAIFACMGVGASALAAVNSAVDFSLQMPAVAVTFAALLGVGVAQSIGHRGHGEDADSLAAER
jgi:O-antigen ligase